MKEIMNNILKSFNTKREGYSSRKLTAFVIVLMVIITHIKWLTLGNLVQLEMVLSIDYAFIAALFEKYKKAEVTKDDKKEETPDEPSEN